MAMRYMMARGCFYGQKLFEEEEYELCALRPTGNGNYRGHWITGFGFGDLFFPGEFVRELTPEEIQSFEGQYLIINGVKCGPLKIIENLKNAA